MKTIFAVALVSLVSTASIGLAQVPSGGIRSETIYNCADASGRLEVKVRSQQGSWTEGVGEQASHIFQRYVTTLKLDGKPATMLSASCRGAWRARAALCSAQAGDVRYDLFRGVDFPAQISAIAWVGNQSTSVKVFCKQAE